jgi:hypothetical protein
MAVSYLAALEHHQEALGLFGSLDVMGVAATLTC